MSILELKEILGECIIKKTVVSADKNGLYLKQLGRNNYYYADNITDNNFFPISGTGQIYPKQGLFSKNHEKQIIIYQISKNRFNLRGFTSKMHFDADYNNVAIDLRIPYDATFAVDNTEISSFINYAFGLYSGNFVDYEIIAESLHAHINTVIKKIIGTSGIYITEDLETYTDILNRDVISELNIAMKMNSTGVVFTDVKLQINDDYEHRQEKKRYQHEKVINGGI